MNRAFEPRFAPENPGAVLQSRQRYGNLNVNYPAKKGRFAMSKHSSAARSSMFYALVLAFSGTALAQDVPSWLNPDERLSQQAQSAKSAGVSASDATIGIIGGGIAPAAAVQGVISTYGSCSAVEDSVAAALQRDPISAYDVVSGINDLESCPCSADNVWPHTRIESRLRVPTRRFEAVGLGVSSNCVAIAANAAAKAAPEQANAILSAVIGDPYGRPGVDRDGRQTVDTIGKSGEARDVWQGDMSGKAFALTREGSNCEGDRDTSDTFGVIAGWSASAEMRAESIGKPAGRCNRRANDLVISSFQTDGGDVNAVEILNNTAVDINLKRAGYVLDIYAKGSDKPSQTIALTPMLPAGSAVVIASKSAPEELRERAQLVLSDLSVTDVNALALRRGFTSQTDCSRAPIALGMVATSLGDSGEQWLDETAKRYEAESSVQQVDAVGSVGVKADAWLGPKVGQPITVARQESRCDGDANAADDFNGAPGWAVSDGVGAANLGSVEGRCVNAARDLVISEYQNDAEKFRTVAVMNNTGAQVDLGEAGYVLEVYADGASSPSNTIPLKGVIANGQSVVISDENAPADVKAKSNLVTNELAASQINALVLKRVVASSSRACQADVIAAAKDIALPVELAEAQPFVPSREPRTDDAIDNRPIGAEVASPN
jgi:hypothetical protein